MAREEEGRRLYLSILTLVSLAGVDGTYTIIRRYSRGVLQETYSVNTVLLLAECIKVIISGFMIQCRLMKTGDSSRRRHFYVLIMRSYKMIFLALLYLVGNTISYFSLKHIGAGIFVVMAQGKTFTTSIFSVLMLSRTFSPTRWRALLTQVLGVILFLLPTLDTTQPFVSNTNRTDFVAGLMASLLVITISGFASCYFEYTIKNDPTDIWERNFQLGFHSIFVYLLLAITSSREDGGGIFCDWTPLASVLSLFGAVGGLLVALSIKYAGSVLKTLAISISIIYAALVDHVFMNGPLNMQMILSAIIIIVSITNYTFDATPISEYSKRRISTDDASDEIQGETNTIEKIKDEP